MKPELMINEDEFELDFEVYEVSSSTVLEEMGASLGWNSCSVIVPKTY